MDFDQTHAWRQGLHMLPLEDGRVIARYIEGGGGMSLGTFHQALLSNDLSGAVRSADVCNLAALRDYVEFLQFHAPAECHGSMDRLMTWSGTHAVP